MPASRNAFRSAVLLSASARATAACRRPAVRRGAVLLEFALISLTLYILVAAVFEFGRAIHGAQSVQAAADLAAREIARVPLSPTSTFYEAMQDPRFQAVYSEDYLVISLSGWSSGQSLIQYLDSLPTPLPVVNRTLVPLMFVDTVGGNQVLRYPGALVTSQTAPSGLTVKVPLVVSSPGVGPETIEWHDVLEPILPSGVTLTTATSTTDPFSVAWTDPSGSGLPGGAVAVRLNYPFQAAALSGFKPAGTDVQGNLLANAGYPMTADDGGVSATNAIPGGGTPVAPDTTTGQYSGTYGGTYGLGEQGALGVEVRPFRSVSSAQAIYRREVYGP